MNSIKSKIIIGIVCFILGIASVLFTQKLSHKPGVTLLASNPPHTMKSMDSLFDPLSNEDFFAHSADAFENIRKMRKQMLQQFNQTDETSGLFDSWFPKKFGDGDVGDLKKHEDKDFVYYDIDIKDIDRDKLKVRVEDGQITISGQMEKRSEESGSGSYYSSSFQRSFPAPPDTDPDRFLLDQQNDTIVLKFPKRRGV